MTVKQRAFVAAMIADYPRMEGAARVLRAGYASKDKAGAAVLASKMLANPVIKAALERALYEKLWAHELTADRVLREARYIALADPADMVDAEGNPLSLRDMRPEARRAIRRMRISRRESADGGAATTTSELETRRMLTASPS